MTSPDNTYNSSAAFRAHDDVQQLTSGPVLLANTLAWAVQNDTPLPDAVLSLTKTGRPITGLNIEIFPVMLKQPNWDKSLHALYKDLIQGRPLGQSLRRRMAYFLPEYYLRAVTTAEIEGNLPIILPAFARRLNYVSNIQVAYKQSMALPLLEMMVIMLLCLCLLVFIVPNLIRIFDELIPRNNVMLLDHIKDVSSSLGNIIGWPFRSLVNFGQIVFSAISLISLWIIFKMRIVRGLKKILIIVPGIWRELYELERLEMLTCMASYLDAGEDMLNAAKFSMNSSHSYLIRNKLRRFIADLKHGKDWLQSWEQAGLGKPLDNLLLHTSNATDQVLTGFETILQWSSSQIYRQSKHNRRRVGIAMTLFNAIIVAILAFSLFQGLIYTVNSQAKTTGFETVRELEAMR